VSSDTNSRFVKTDIWRTLFGKSKLAYKRQGPIYLAKLGLGMAVDVPKNGFMLWYYKRFKSTKTFTFQGKEYRYLIHPYCTSWKNERSVIVPIIRDIMKDYVKEKKNILEIGNTLSYIYPVSHDILDKYEVVEGVINEDVVSFNPNKTYDLIFSIVTMQCIGWDEVPREPTKLIPALRNLYKLLSPEGKIIVSLGLGYNPDMDSLLQNGKFNFDRQYYLKKISNLNWEEVQYDEIKSAKYDKSAPTSTGVVIGIKAKK
jgi:SAM-dependent methyltransferase